MGSHCLHCIEEGARSVRKATPLPWQRRAPTSAIAAIVALCVAGFVLQFIGAQARGGFDQITVRFGAVGSAIAAGEWYRLVTSMFLHHGAMHLVFNMVALWLFGREVEAREGALRTAAIFLVAGIVGGVAAFVVDDPGAVAVGASGGVFGLLGVCLVRTWRSGASVQPIVTLLVINLGIGLVIPSISLAAHIGGFVAGVAYAAPTLLSRRYRPDIASIAVLVALGVAAAAVVLHVAPGALG